MKNKLKNLKITDIILFILAFALVANSAIFVTVYLDYSSTFYYKEDYIINDIIQEEYHDGLTELSYYRISEENVSTIMQECLALADYYNAAVLYSAYLEDGQTEVSNTYYAIMEESKDSTGSLFYNIAIINEQLNIQ